MRALASISFLCFLCGCREGAPTAAPSTKRPGILHSPAELSPRPEPSGTRSSKSPEIGRRDDGSGDKGTQRQPRPSLVGAGGVQRVYRPADDRPTHDDAALASVGIQKYESRHLRLYTDIAPHLARALPGLMDAAYTAWEAYFGPLPPDSTGSPFQMTGYLMKSAALFRETGLLPDDLPATPHGRNRGRQFWMHDQTEDYYRRHLLLHEGTHCYMMAVPSGLQRHIWYMEGMAELFATHAIGDDGVARFGVMPDIRERFAGLGRIRLVNDDVRAGRLRSVADVIGFVPNDYLQNAAYAWSWALCEFLSSDRHYREKFQAIGRAAVSGGTPSFDEFFAAGGDDLHEAWLLFAANLCHGYETERAAVDFRTGEPLEKGKAATVEIAADRGWQSSGVQVEAGKTYRVTADGRYVIARGGREAASSGTSLANANTAGSSQQIERAWECEPQGVSIRYNEGRPLGMLLGTIRGDAGALGSMGNVLPLGREAQLVAPVTGTLYLRVNDAWNELAENAGKVVVQIEAN